MQVYLPDDLFRAVKGRGLRASELLQRAVRLELRRQRLLRETDRYVAELTKEVGVPTAADRARARKLLGAPKRSRARRSA
jgi:post-segregation antitoxin (ccd killing protein)